MIAVVVDYLKSENIPFEIFKDASGLTTGPCSLNLHNFTVKAQQLPGAKENLVMFSIFPERVTRYRLPAVIELVNDMNWHNWVGSFVVNFETGEIQHRPGFLLCMDCLTPELIKNMHFTTSSAMDKWFRAIHEVINFKSSPIDAIAKTLQQDLSKNVKPCGNLEGSHDHLLPQS